MSLNSSIVRNREPDLQDEELHVAEKEKDEAKTQADGDQGQPTQEQLQRAARVEVNDKNAVCLYANFCRVTGTPEELILDFGLNAQPFGVPSEPVEVKQRIVTNYYTAKRMLQALHMSVQRHEQAFGVLETDVQKRVIGGGRTRAQS
jgi:hypothetical protein